MAEHFGARRAATARRGFTLIELMTVVAIIGILLGLLVSGLWAVKIYQRKVEAKTTAQNMLIGMVSLKRNYEFDQMTPVGVYTNGAVTAGEVALTDTNRDFPGDGIKAGDEVFILGSIARSRRDVVAVDATSLTLSGANFARSARSQDYFIVRQNGDCYPAVNIAKELDPANIAWASTFTPHINTRRLQYYPCRKRNIREDEFRDPWSTPYRYELVPREKIIEERVVSAGPDARFGTDDDIVEINAEIPFGG